MQSVLGRNVIFEEKILVVEALSGKVRAVSECARADFFEGFRK